MFTTTKYVITIPSYKIQKDLYSTGIAYTFASFTFLELLRSQVPEMNVLQLIPGYYYFLLFVSFVVMFGLSYLLFYIGKKIDVRKATGRKSPNKMLVIILTKLGFFITFASLLLVLNTVIPLSYDSFDISGQTMLVDVWSFQEIIGLETGLICFLILICQVPIVSIINLDTEEDGMKLPAIWKDIIVVSLLIAGVITPSFDANTQLCLATGGLIFYVLVITIVQKVLKVKYTGTCVLG